MSNLEKALQRLRTVGSPEDLKRLVHEEPVLVALETDRFLAQEEEDARSQGDTATADGLAGLRQLLSLVRAFSTASRPSPLAEAMDAWLTMETWQDSRDFLQAHSELLSDDAVALLMQLREADQQSGLGPEETGVAEDHLTIIERARKDGIEAAYHERIAQEEAADRALPDDDILDGFLLGADLREETPPAELAKRQADAPSALDRLGKILDDPSPGRKDLNDALLYSWQGCLSLSLDDVPRAQHLYGRVLDVGGTGSARVQKSLLELIGATADPSSVPFLTGLVDITRARDSFSSERRALATAALACIAIQHDDEAARQALRGLTRHKNQQVQALAIYYLGRAYLDLEKALPADVQEELSQAVTAGRTFYTRFQARAVLRAANMPADPDNPDGVYAFKVTCMWDRTIHRTIEVRSNQTLDDLHYAIQDAIKWDADHLYSFYLNGVAWDSSYEFTSPDADEGPRWTPEWTIGELGLVRKHKFLYLFDYGDRHRFEVEVVDIQPKAKRGKYPRVVDSQGKAPKQYWSDEDEEDS